MKFCSPFIYLLAGVGACAAPQPTETDSELEHPAVSFYVDGSSGNGICGGSGNHSNSAGVDGTCNGSATTVRLTADGGGQDGINAVNAAIGHWNLLLEQAKTFNVPKLSQASSGGIPVHFPSSTTGGDFCGLTSEGTGSVAGITITSYVNGGSACSSKRRGTLEQVVTHEIAHVLGLNQQHGGTYARNSPLTGNGQCTSYIPTGQGFGGITTSVCYHEVETIIRARNGSGYQYDPDFYTSPLAFGTDVTPRTTSVQTGSNRTFVVNSWSLKPSGTIARGATSLGWTSTAPSQAMVVSAGVVQGEQAGVGQGAITVRLSGLTSALPTGYQFWTPFKSRGDSVTVTVGDCMVFCVNGRFVTLAPGRDR